MAEALLEVVDLHRSFGGVAAVAGVSLEVRPGEIHAVIGPNGAGKTTLISLLAGELRPDRGRIRLAGRDLTGRPAHARARLGLARSFQITSLLPEMRAIDNVALAVLARRGGSFRCWRPARRDPALAGPALAALERVGLAHAAEERAGAISHGEHRQLEIAMTLAAEPELLLLDEPMAGMSAEESRRMTAILAGLKGEKAMLLVEHDMDVVFALADRVSVLVGGRIAASGAPEAVRADPAVRRAYLGDEAA